MPTTKLKNAVYRCALPILATNVSGKMRHQTAGRSLNGMAQYERLLRKHHVLGASFMLRSGKEISLTSTSLTEPKRNVDENSLFRIASITKTLTALSALRFVEKGAFTLDSPASALLQMENCPQLDGVTVENILCHTSGLVDCPEYEQAVRLGEPLDKVLAQEGCRKYPAGEKMEYSNFAFGLMGSILETVSGMNIGEIFRNEVTEPLMMQGSFTPERDRVVPMNRVLPYRKENEIVLTSLGTKQMTSADPMHHFGYTAGGFYTNCRSLSNVLEMLTSMGCFEGRQYLKEETIREMTSLHSATATRKYGLGLVILERQDISSSRITGHQGFAYGCVDGMFAEEETGRQVIMLNGGCSELREGKLAQSNREFMQFGFREMDSWQK